jgi:hypothetical protein
MKSLTTRIMIVAAALVTAGAASAQGMRAEIPFAFHAGGTVLAAGEYQVSLGGLGGTVTIRDTAHHTAVIAMPVTHIDRKGESAKLVFACTSGACSLVQAWPGDGSGLQFKAPKSDPAEETSLTVVRLSPAAE